MNRLNCFGLDEIAKIKSNGTVFGLSVSNCHSNYGNPFETETRNITSKYSQSQYTHSALITFQIIFMEKIEKKSNEEEKPRRKNAIKSNMK